MTKCDPPFALYAKALEELRGLGFLHCFHKLAVTKSCPFLLIWLQRQGCDLTSLCEGPHPSLPCPHHSKSWLWSMFPAGEHHQPAQKLGLACQGGTVLGKHTQPILWLPISFCEGKLTINSCQGVLCSCIFWVTLIRDSTAGSEWLVRFFLHANFSLILEH